MKKILIINGNPHKESFCYGLAAAYEKGAKNAGAEVKRINLADLKFDPILHEGYHIIQPLEPDLLTAQEAIKWSDHLVFVFPVWWMAPPALMKGFFDRIFLPGFAFKYHQGYPFLEKLLKGRSARLIVTMDSHPLLNLLLYRTNGYKALAKGALGFCGIRPVKKTVFGLVKYLSETKRKKIILRVEKLGEKMA
ncbi:MAG: NAD(P)H dehydrogenase (Quinone):NADPH-dependent FMN reductase [Parcubacteria group bacterium GW2011_GWE2_39_37]|nr:MAG: NAD(P)H dehydrogenase (Quinone):NADPH-dependent FMN reductase [Parcubacteria group bacterium GW2011_GWE2_39_37]